MVTMTDERARVENTGELVRRLPELQAIRGRVQSEVARVFVEGVDQYFWLARASENHHPPDERGLGGLWLHTKRVFTAYTMLEPSFRAMSAISSFEANCARGAVLLHDAFKYGRAPDDTSEDHHEYADGLLDRLPEYTVPEHDVEMAAYVRAETDLPETVARCIECHGGSNSWRSHAGPEPHDDVTLLVHLADVVASNNTHRIPVHEPARELTMMCGDVPAIENRKWLDDLDQF